jgi:predicted phage terminase large subunit-like protein
LLWLDCVRVRKEIPDIVPEIDKVYRLWDLSYVGIETVAANRAVYQIAKRSRMLVRELSPRGVDKLVRATPAIVLAESGRIWLPVSAPWLDDAVGELLRYTGDEKVDAHDDVVDTVAYAARLLTEKTDQRAGFRPYVVGG